MKISVFVIENYFNPPSKRRIRKRSNAPALRSNLPSGAFRSISENLLVRAPKEESWRDFCVVGIFCFMSLLSAFQFMQKCSVVR